MFTTSDEGGGLVSPRRCRIETAEEQREPGSPWWLVGRGSWRTGDHAGQEGWMSQMRVVDLLGKSPDKKIKVFDLFGLGKFESIQKDQLS